MFAKKKLAETVITAIAALTLAASSASAFAPSIAKMQGARRVLIVSAPSGADANLKRQQDMMRAWRQGAADRDVSEVRIIGDSVEGASDAAAAIRRNYDLPDTRFAVLLIGKDGHVAIRSMIPISSSDLSRKIDAMPMRRAGQR